MCLVNILENAVYVKEEKASRETLLKQQKFSKFDACTYFPLILFFLWLKRRAPLSKSILLFFSYNSELRAFNFFSIFPADHFF
jgi:hypothetical protein